MKKYLNWIYLERIFRTIEFLIIIAGVCFSTYQINDLINNQLSRKNQLSIMYYDRLTTGTNGEILIMIEHNKSIFKKYTTDDLDMYLNDLNGVGNSLEKNLLDSDMICSDFSDIINKSFENKEVNNYISDSRKMDDSYFRSIDDLYNYVIKNCD